MNCVDVHQGNSPLILAMPHVGTEIPADISARLNNNGRILADTDWHVYRLYDGLVPNVTTVCATFHRYVIDANRDPAGMSLYPGQNTTDLISEIDFDGKPIWHSGQEPTKRDIAERIARFHAPYHAVLTREVERVRARNGVAILYDCHSIRSRIPYLFIGKLPDFNIGTNNGRTCSPIVESAVVEIVAAAANYTHVVNGRFKGGWTTRHYGRPETGVHAIQMELAQSTHLANESPPFAYDSLKAEQVREHLKKIIERLVAIARKLEQPGK